MSEETETALEYNGDSFPESTITEEEMKQIENSVKSAFECMKNTLRGIGDGILTKLFEKTARTIERLLGIIENGRKTDR